MQEKKVNNKVALIIDDSTATRHFLAEYLQKNGYYVESTPDGNDGLKKFESIQPSLTFLDIVPFGMSGVGVLKRIKIFDSTAKVIMMFSIRSEKVIKQVKSLGADFFLSKPFTKEQIINIINRFGK